MTDSEKEIHMRGGTRSEGTRTPRLRRTGTTVTTTATTVATNTITANINNNHHTPATAVQPQLLPPLMHPTAQQTPSTAAACGERHLDVLYLRAAASQPPKQLVEKMYAQLKPKPPKSSSASANVYHTITAAASGHAAATTLTTTTSLAASSQQHHHHHHYQQVMMRANCSAIVKPQAVVLTSADDYVLLQNHHQIQQQQQQQLHKLQYHQQQQPIYQSTGGSVISGVSAGRLSVGAGASADAIGATAIAAANKCLLRQTLLAITDNYVSGTMAVHKGDVVTLLACRQVVDPRIGQPVQWFFVRARDGTQGYIPAEVAGHGFL